MSTTLPSLAGSALLLASLCSSAAAEELFYCGSDFGQIGLGNPAQGDFDFIGACGGPAHSLAMVGDTLYIGDTSGNVYSWEEGGFVGYAFTTAGGTEALVEYQGDLLLAGDDAMVRRYSTGGQLLDSWQLSSPVTAGLVVGGDELLLGTTFGAILRLDLATGTESWAGSCGGPVGGMVLDQESSPTGELLLSSTDGNVYRVDVATGTILSWFAAPNDGAALALHMGDLLIGGSDGSIFRIDAETGQVLATLEVADGLDKQALLLLDQPEPGSIYCYGVGCPCANDDPTAGCANNTGVGARLRASGSASVTADDLFLTVSSMPNGQFGRFYMGAGAANAPFGNGLLCAGSGGYGQFRFDLFFTGQTGFASLGLGVVDHSEQNFGATGQIFPGQTWLFQAWFRDPGGPCGSSFNTSNGLMVTFQP